MQTQDMQAEQEPKVDPAQVALNAINDFDRYAAEHVVESVAWQLAARAELRVQYAQLAEMRKQTAYLNSIESWLLSIDGELDGITEHLEPRYPSGESIGDEDAPQNLWQLIDQIELNTRTGGGEP